MKPKSSWLAIATGVAALCQSLSGIASGTISAINHYAWSASSGWLDFRPERPGPGDGFTFGEFSCGGWIWSPNIGWINCGSGAPADGVSYANTNDVDFGVNHYGTGDLYGLAWSPNTGWINFGWWILEPGDTNRPHVNLATGQFSGYAWSANCGWINLGSGQLKTDRMEIVDSDGDGISDAFEMGYAGNLTTMDATSDYDKDGQTDKAEYISGTDPLNPNSALKINRLSKLPDVNAVELEWASSPARVYDIEAKLSVADTNWLYVDTIPGAPSNVTLQAIEMGVPQAFFRIKVRLPLQP